jgi:hypothetical protein
VAWARFDDRFHENRKIKRAWRLCPASIGLHVMAITYCAGHLTDGFVDVDFVEDRMPSKRARERAVAVLVEVGLWSAADEGWHVHDFCEFNETKAGADAKRRAKSEAGKKGAAMRYGHNRELAAAMAPASSVLGSRMPNHAPVPSRPEPSTPFNSPRGNRKRDLDEFDARMRTWAEHEFPDRSVTATVGYARAAVASGAKTVDEVRAYVERHSAAAA